jgi:NADH dehydrogenase (ubiquinone) 1 alpha/beta subcomplex 1, acyl-carrier protein
MFRNALLRSARAAVVARPAISSSRTLITAAAKPIRVAAMAPRIQSVQAVRMYSAGGALNQQEVEGRIMSLLQGFDKVSLWNLNSPL